MLFSRRPPLSEDEIRLGRVVFGGKRIKPEARTSHVLDEERLEEKEEVATPPVRKFVQIVRKKRKKKRRRGRREKNKTPSKVTPGGKKASIGKT